MNYEQFIKNVSKYPEQDVSSNLWERIIQTIDWKAKSISSANIIRLFETGFAIAAAAAVIMVVSLNFHQRSVVNSYFQNFGSTEYIYELYK